MGVPGASPKIPSPTTPGTAPSAAEAPQKTSSQSQRQTETINYEISKITKRIVSPYSEVKRLSVAVLVDGIYKKKKDGIHEYIARSAGELAKLEDLVKGAMGFDAKRGDQLQMVNVPVDNSILETEVETMGEGYWPYWLIPLLPVLKKSLSLIIILILFSLFILKPLLNWLSRSELELSLPKELPKSLKELEIEAGSPLKEMSGLSSREKAIEIAKSAPSRAAQLAKEWLSEGD